MKSFSDRLTSIEQQISQLQADLYAFHDRADPFSPVFYPAPGEAYYCVKHTRERGMVVSTTRQHTGEPATGSCPAFRTEAAAAAFADAFAVMLELRTCDGVCPPQDDTRWLIGIYNGTVQTDPCADIDGDLDRCFSPCFRTAVDAMLAIEKVGKVRISRAMRTLAGIID